MLQKFKIALKREIIIYVVMLLLLAIVMHVDLLSNPSARFELLYEKGDYAHPFLYTLVIYTIIFIIRKVIDIIVHLFQQNTK